MSDNGLALIAGIMALDPSERRVVVEELVSRIQDSDEDAEILSLAEKRWKELEANPDAWVSHEEVMRSLGRR